MARTRLKSVPAKGPRLHNEPFQTDAWFERSRDQPYDGSGYHANRTTMNHDDHTPAPMSPDEPLRLAALHALGLVDTPAEERFDRVTRLVRNVLGVPISAVSLVGADRQFFKSIQGLNVRETPRDVAFCAHTILNRGPLVVNDARTDPRFLANPLVTADPRILFYAGVPLRSPEGLAVGSLCAIDRKPRTMTEREQQILIDLAAIVETELNRPLPGASGVASILDGLGSVDELTRVWDGATVTRLMKMAAEQRAGERSGFSVARVELDDFAVLGATVGRPAANEVLRIIARRLVSAVRDADAVGRIGEDAFLVVFPGCAGLPDAKRAVARLRERVFQDPVRVRRIEGAPATPVPVTATIGVICVGDGIEIQADRVLADAQANVERARQQGPGNDLIDGAWAA